jgi:hypothetical protein
MVYVSKRRGLTRVEVVIVAGICAVALGLLLPVIQKARAGTPTPVPPAVANSNEASGWVGGLWDTLCSAWDPGGNSIGLRPQEPCVAIE